MVFKDIKFQVEIDNTAIKLLLENSIQYIDDRIVLAKSMKDKFVKLINGVMIEREVWIKEAETELELLKIERKKL